MRRKRFQWLRLVVIWTICVAATLLVGWFAPSFKTATTNLLFRLRGELHAPENVVIVAIDDASLQRIGKYPWSRSITATALEKITAGKPAVVGIDIVYAEETDPEVDRRLASAILENGRVVLPVQLFENVSENSAGKDLVWLKPLPELERAAAGEGHAHAAPDTDGTLRSIQLSKTDDQGNRFWAFGLEVLRVAEDIKADDFSESADRLRFGNYDIKLTRDESVESAVPGVSTIRANEMLINYVGAANSFRYYSFADVIEGKVTPEAFTGKIVLVGATSPTLGDAQVTPFMQFAGEGECQGGQAMPGVEVHANVINTIKNRLYLRSLPEFYDFCIALLIITIITGGIIWLDGWRQIALLSMVFLAIVAGSLFAFNHYFLILPLPEMLTAFFVGVPLFLLDRSFAASRDLDIKLQRLSEVQKGFLLDETEKNNQREISFPIVPRNLESKLRAVDDITARLFARMSFIDRVLTGMNEGVIVADVSHRIVFVNERFSEMFGIQDLINQDLSEFFLAQNIFTDDEWQRATTNVLAGETSEKEFQLGVPFGRVCFLQLSPVTAGDDSDGFPDASETVIGILILLRDVTEQRELDRLKAETVQLVSHELRAPLTSIQGLSDVLLKFPVDADESKEMLTTIHSEAIRLNEMINRFLDLKRLESGALDLQIAPVAINDLLKSCISAAGSTAAEKGIKIRTIGNRHLPVIQADGQLLSQAIGNLLTNAVKYSPPNAVVTVKTGIVASELLITVRDNGHGIPPHALEVIFDKFYRLERDANSEIVGTGLGLAFVKEVVEKHGGRVLVESEENIGSTFVLYLPL
ncbi:MAG TPA: CHASE2 domain-containing protein [Pyrinomonadaceae bacterium]